MASLSRSKCGAGTMTRYVPCASSELCSRVRNHRKRFSLVGGACRLRWCDPRPGAEPCHTPMMHAMHRWRQPQVAKCEANALGVRGDGRSVCGVRESRRQEGELVDAGKRAT